jgi:predicted RNA-binding Zn-ribbon protein involved in translation (DUF1610 family)
MSDSKENQKAMKLAANSAAFKQPLPPCPFCGKALAVISRSETYQNVSVAIQCTECGKSLSRNITK